MVLVFSILGYIQTLAQIIDGTEPGNFTWTCPANVTQIKIEVIGAGGGVNWPSNNDSRGGGGGGAYAQKTVLNVTPFSTYRLTVGTGGSGTGGDSYFGNTETGNPAGAVVLAKGGAGSTGDTGGNGGSSLSSIGDIKYSGGKGADKVSASTGGGGGGAGGALGNGNSGSGRMGGASGSGYIFVAPNNGLGGNGSSGSGNGFAGLLYGGGGGASVRNGGTGNSSSAGANGAIRITYIYSPPLLTSFTPSSGCIGSTVTITGNHFNTASNVSFNGVSAGFVINSDTQITATVPNGATGGKITVTTPGGTATSATNFTPNPTPSAIAGGADTVCMGTPSVPFTNTVSGGTWSVINGTGSATISTGGVVTGVSAGTVTVQYTVGSCTASRMVTISGNPVLISSPVNATVSSGSNTSFTVAASNNPTAYQWQVSANGGSTWTTVTNTGVYSNATTATLNITGATLGMNGYLYRASAVNTCGTTANSASASLTVGLAYCAPTGNLNCTTDGDFIANVTVNTLNNTSTCNSGGYTLFPQSGTQTTTLVKGYTYALSLKAGPGTGNHGAGVWIDFNQNGSFSDTGEFFFISNTITANATRTVNIAVPVGALSGDVRMRIRYAYNINVVGGSGMSCTMAGTYGETEDYTITVAAPATCSVPTAQPSLLNFVRSSTSISGNFTPSSPAATNYLVIRSTNSTPPSAPSNGTNYVIGSTYATGYIVVDNDANPSFTATGLSNNTTYYFYIYAFNAYCTGSSPLYNTTNPLIGSTTTTIFSYCLPTTSASTEFISNITSVGTLADNSNPSGYSVNGFGDYTSIILATQIPNNGINLNVDFNAGAAEGQFIKVWVDWNKNGDFSDAGEEMYTTGNTATGSTSFGILIPAGQLAGDYRLRIKTRNFGGTGSNNSTFDSCSNYERGETEDYTIRVVDDCAAKITGIINGAACGPSNTVTLSASTTASKLRWYSQPSGGSYIETNPGSWTTPVLSTTTTYYVTAWNGTCETKFRTPVVATIHPSTNITISAAVPTVCGEDVKIQLTAAGDFVKETVLSQDFENGIGVWAVATSADTNSGADSPWSVKTSAYQPSTTTVWKPAINSGAVGSTENKFAFSTSDYKDSNFVTHMTSPSVNVSAYNSLILTFDHYYSYYGGDKGEIQVATDAAGTNWTTVKIFDTDLGSASKFTAANIDLTPYKDTSTLRIRFLYTAQWDDGWAVDNIKVEGIKLLPATFTWSGDTSSIFADCSSAPPALGASSSVCIKPPLSEYETKEFWTVNATATLSTGCSVTSTIIIPNNNKFWNTTESSSWTDSKWKPNTAMPTSDKCVIVKSPLIVPVGANGSAKKIIIESTGKLTVNQNSSITVTDEFINRATAADVVIESDGGLIQVNNSPTLNTGSITAKRTLNLSSGRQQYNYISSPLEGQSLKNIYSGIDYVLYHNEANNFFYSSSGAYIKGRGLAVKEPNKTAVPTVNTTVSATFTGYPTNGTFSYGIVNSNLSQARRGFNLIGNPYPSNIDLNAFYTLNGGSTGTLSSTFYLWDNRANSQTVQKGDLYGGQAYAQFNAEAPPGSGTGTLATGDAGLAGINRPTKIIKMGQAFMVKTSESTQQLTFNNTIRTADNGTVSFFGKEGKNIVSPVDRYWLNLITPDNLASNIAVVYFEGGNNVFAKDDSFSMGGSDVVYSLVGTEKISINGRSSFTEDDVIPLGTAHYAGGNYTIALQEKEGVFAAGQNIYLKDKQTGLITNLSEGNYTFTANKGESTGRFEIIYRPETVLTTDGTVKEEIQVYRDGSFFVVKAQTKKITILELYDAAGKLIEKMQPNNTNVKLNSETMVNGFYILKIMQGDETYVKKIIK